MVGWVAPATRALAASEAAAREVVVVMVKTARVVEAGAAKQQDEAAQPLCRRTRREGLAAAEMKEAKAGS